VVDGLHDMRIEACLLRLPAVLILTPAGQRDQLRIATPGLRSEMTRYVIAIGARQSDIKQHDVRPELGRAAIASLPSNAVSVSWPVSRSSVANVSLASRLSSTTRMRYGPKER